jgi:hypothetical protein
MKYFVFTMFVATIAACDPLATCDDSDFPELCGSDVCDTLRECCEANVEQSNGVASACGKASDALAEVPEPLRQAARDETCKQVLEQSDGLCE